MTYSYDRTAAYDMRQRGPEASAQFQRETAGDARKGSALAKRCLKALNTKYPGHDFRMEETQYADPRIARAEYKWAMKPMARATSSVGIAVKVVLRYTFKKAGRYTNYGQLEGPTWAVEIFNTKGYEPYPATEVKSDKPLSVRALAQALKAFGEDRALKLLGEPLSAQGEHGSAVSLKDVELFFASQRTWFEHDQTNPGHILYGTRENGSVGDEEAGREDWREAVRLKKVLLKRFGQAIEVEVSTVDEWVHLEVSLGS